MTINRNRFRKGSGCFTCRLCGRKTRDTGSNGSAELCPQCDEASMLENSMSDNGETPEDLLEWQGLLDECEKLGGKPDRTTWWRR